MEFIISQRNGTRPNGHTKQTHCQNGHPFTEENTYISPKSQKRTCIVCTIAYRRRRQKDPKVKEYFRNKMRSWRLKHPEQNKETYNNRRREKKEWLDLIRSVGCSKCSEKDPACIDFHHRDPSKKDVNISVAVAHWSIEKLQEEIKKCDLLCCNCHRKLHAKEREIAAGPQRNEDTVVS
jgi:hypothetical protein